MGSNRWYDEYQEEQAEQSKQRIREARAARAHLPLHQRYLRQPLEPTHAPHAEALPLPPVWTPDPWKIENFIELINAELRVPWLANEHQRIIDVRLYEYDSELSKIYCSAGWTCHIKSDTRLIFRNPRSNKKTPV